MTFKVGIKIKHDMLFEAFCVHYLRKR